MKVWKIASVTVLVASVAVYAYQEFQVNQEIQFRKPLTTVEVDGLAAITAGQMDCNWSYESTDEGEWLRLRAVAERKVDVTFQARFMAAMGKYQGLDPDKQCDLLDNYPNLVRRWHD